MPLPILNLATRASCPHGVPVSLAASSAKLLVAGSPAMLDGDLAPVSGCPFTVPTGKPQPCVIGKLVMKTSKVLAEGRAVLLQGPADTCQSAEQIVQGPVIYSVVQSKVLAT